MEKKLLLLLMYCAENKDILESYLAKISCDAEFCDIIADICNALDKLGKYSNLIAGGITNMEKQKLKPRRITRHERRRKVNKAEYLFTHSRNSKNHMNEDIIKKSEIAQTHEEKSSDKEDWTPDDYYARDMGEINKILRLMIDTINNA